LKDSTLPAKLSICEMSITTLTAKSSDGRLVTDNNVGTRSLQTMAGEDVIHPIPYYFNI